MVKVDRETRLKLRIFLGFVIIYFGSFISIFSIIFAFFNLVNGFPEPYFLSLGIFMSILLYIVFDFVVWSDIEELTKLKIKESEVDGKNEGAKD